MQTPALPPQIQLSIKIHATPLDLPQQLVRAMVFVESGGDHFAWNPEPRYRYLWDVARDRPFRPLKADEIASEIPPPDFRSLAGDRDAEWWGQQASWGPLQVMGAVARELRFDQHFPALCDASLGIQVGVRHLDNLRRRFFARDGWHGVAAAYNAGSPRRRADGAFENQPYVDKIAAAGGFSGI